MQLQTPVTITPFTRKISYHTPVLLAGSCFAEHIGQKMAQRKLPITPNPFGIVYNPVSIAQSLHRLHSGKPFTEQDLICCNECWTTFFHHSAFSHPNKATFLHQANTALQKGKDAFHQAPFIIISLGTSWTYRHKERNVTVNNCQKFPAAQFERTLLSADDTAAILADAIAAYPSKTWIFTISPIRHWKDGAHGNQVSKAHLLVAVDRLQQQFDNVLYFPAYEIMMDELRDYRFYADDLLHPSNRAIDYIWELFTAAAFDEETQNIIREWEKIMTAQQHRLIHPHTIQSKQFAEHLKKQTNDFFLRYPFIQTN